VESSSWLGRTAGWSERTWVCVRRNNARSWLVGYLWRARHGLKYPVLVGVWWKWPVLTWIGCCGELKLTRAHGGLIRKDVSMCQKEQCTQLTRWLPLESSNIEILGLGYSRSFMGSFMNFALRDFRKGRKNLGLVFTSPIDSMQLAPHWGYLLPTAQWPRVHQHTRSFILWIPLLFFWLGCFFSCCFCWGVFVFGVGVFGGACETFLFEKLHAQFAYYKSPELGLNLSGS